MSIASIHSDLWRGGGAFEVPPGPGTPKKPRPNRVKSFQWTIGLKGSNVLARYQPQLHIRACVRTLVLIVRLFVRRNDSHTITMISKQALHKIKYLQWSTLMWTTVTLSAQTSLSTSIFSLQYQYTKWFVRCCENIGTDPTLQAIQYEKQNSPKTI